MRGGREENNLLAHLVRSFFAIVRHYTYAILLKGL